MQTLALLLLAAAGAHTLARALRLPAVPFLLMAGFLLGVVGPDVGAFVQDALILGVTVLVFISGIDLDPRRPQGQLKTALAVGTGQFALLAGLGVATAVGIGYGIVPAAYLGLALAASSTLVVVRLLQGRGEMFEPYGRLTIGVLLVQDILVILLIPVVDSLGADAASILPRLLLTGVLLAIAILVVRPLAHLLLRVEDDGEALLLTTLLVLVAFLAGSVWMGLPLVVGAFLAGLSLARFPVAAAVRPLMAPLGDFFTALFFTALGALVGIPTLDEVGRALAFTALLLVATPIVVAALGERAGLPARPAVEAGLLLAQASELSLVVGLLGLQQGALDESAFTVLALVTALTMLLTPLIATERVTRRLLSIHPGVVRGSVDPPPSGHVLLLGAGSTGMPLVRTLVAAGREVVVVDDDPQVLERASQAGARLVRGDASDPRTLERTGIAEALVVISTLGRGTDNTRVLEAAGEVPVLVRVFAEGEARRLQELGAIPILTSDAAAEQLMEWFELGSPTPSRQA